MSFDLVLFGGTGDLAWRKLMPALFQAFRHGSLPAGGRIIGVARDDLTDDAYRSFIKARFDEAAVSARATKSSPALQPCSTTSAWTSPARPTTPGSLR